MKAGSLAFALIFIVSSATRLRAFPQFVGKLDGKFQGGDDQEYPIIKRAILSSILSILNVIPKSFNLAPIISVGRKVIPDSEHPFIPPGPTDQRGGCPGLNLLANYGYLPRNGITDMTRLLYALEEGLGLAPDLALVLTALSIKSAVDLTTLKMSIGGTDKRTDGPLTFLFGRAPGLFSPESHNKYEVDGSLATDDAYFANGQTRQFNGTRWGIWYKLAAEKYGGTMPIAWNGDVRFLQYTACRNLNPQCRWAVIEQFVFYGGQAFTSTMTSSEASTGRPGPLLSDSINQFMGIAKQSDQTFRRVPQRLPPGPEGVWYRRTIPLTALELTTAAIVSLTSHLPEFGSNNGKLGHWNPDPTHLPNVITAPTAICLLVNAVLNTDGTRFKGGSLIALGTLLRFTLASVTSQISC